MAGTSGKLVAYGMIVFGAGYALSTGQWQAGLWYAFIGWFLLNAAQESVAQIAIRETLSGLHAADVMSQEIPIGSARHLARGLQPGSLTHRASLPSGITDDRWSA